MDTIVVDALARAEAAAREGRWQDVRRILGGVRHALYLEPRGLYRLAEAHSRLTEQEPARVIALQALERYEALKDREGMMKTENLLGIIHFDLGELDTAATRFRSALALAVEAGALRMRAEIANNLGAVCDLRGEHTQALEFYRIALWTYCDVGDLRGQAQATHNLGIAHKEMEERESARALFAQAADFAFAAGESSLFAFSTIARAELVLEDGAVDEAEQLVRQALPRFDVAASVYGLTEVHRVRGLIAWRRGDLAGAQAHLDAAVDLGDVHGVPLLDAEARMDRGHLLCLLGEAGQGLEDLRRAVDTFEHLGSAGRAARARRLLEKFAAKPASIHVA